jgi:DNA-binding SARP family transcriptional activator
MPSGLVRALALATSPEAPLVKVLGRVTVVHGSVNSVVTVGAARLIAFLALHPGPHDRHVIAGTLWPDTVDARAAGNLRSALWRLNGVPVPLVDVDRCTVSLRPQVLVDVHLLTDWAARVISGERDPQDFAHLPWDVAGVDLLPGWPDDWLQLERERVRQRLLHGLERMGRELIRLGRSAEALEVALVVAGADVLRESGQRILIEAHLAEGNRSEARRCYAEHRELVEKELGVAPSPTLAALLDFRSA